VASYYVWTHDDDARYAWVLNLPEFMVTWKEGYLVEEGVPLSAIMPTRRVFQLDQTRGTMLTDSIPNVCGILLVSKELRTFLERSSGADWEFLPARVKNARGRLLPQPIFIANLLGPSVPLDRKRSDVDWSFRANRTDCIRRLVIDEKELPRSRKIFRLAERGKVLIVREDLVDALIDGPSEGAFFQELSDFGNEWR